METDEFIIMKRDARNAHNSIDKYQQILRRNLKSSPIILSRPPHQILHPINSNLGNSVKDSMPIRLWKEWGEHNLLMQDLKDGWKPLDKWDVIPFEQHHADLKNRTPTHIQALEVAKSRGYNVPEKYLVKNYQISFIEFIAYRASHDLVRNSCLSLGYHPTDFSWQKKLMYFSGQFIIPDPFDKNKPPYIIDQLWVVRHSKDKVRLIALEIDGEHHFKSQTDITKNKQRDRILAQMGYEVYRVAGWWCRIDPFRVIHEFLSNSEIFPDAVHQLVGSEWNSIDDYKCDICHEPIVRHDEYWFSTINKGDSIIIAHPYCTESYEE